MTIGFNYNRGGYTRGSGKHRGDCVPRAITIPTGLTYEIVFDELQRRQTEWRIKSNSKTAYYKKPHRNKCYMGTYKVAYKPYLEELGWTWVPKMFIGQGFKTYLRKEDLPPGRLIVKVRKHLTAVVDGVVNDTWDCSQGGNKGVYGYYYKEGNE